MRTAAESVNWKAVGCRALVLFGMIAVGVVGVLVLGFFISWSRNVIGRGKEMVKTTSTVVHVSTDNEGYTDVVVEFTDTDGQLQRAGLYCWPSLCFQDSRVGESVPIAYPKGQPGLAVPDRPGISAAVIPLFGVCFGLVLTVVGIVGLWLAVTGAAGIVHDLRQPASSQGQLAAIARLRSHRRTHPRRSHHRAGHKV